MRARKLFACALETPGGLKVQTIHALCTRLLQQFPFEANVPARFAVLDERDQTEMMERANLAVLLEASRDPDSADGPRAQYRDGERRRRHLQGRGARGVPEPRSLHGLDRRRRRRRSRGRADVGRARRRPRRSSSRTSSARSSTGRICRDRDGRRSPQSSTPAANPIGTRRGGFAKRWSFTGAAQVDEYLGVFLTDERTPRKSVRDEEIRRQQSGRRAAVRCGKRRASAP